MRAFWWVTGIGTIAAAVFIIRVPDWTVPPVGGVEIGPQPTSMIQFTGGKKPEQVSQTAPAPLPPPTGDGGRKASEAYKNVKVLGDLDEGHFMRLQQAITQWVAPKEGCAFCHTGEDYASDAKPQKAAARLMLSMTRHINATEANHVAPAGVTCYTCHRGQPVPAETWFRQAPPPETRFVAKQDNWQEAADTVRKFFPDAGWDEYFLGDEPISVQSVTALHSNTIATQLVAKRVYEMMMQMSDGMGVNCGYCHNSRALESWEQSSPYRWTAFYAIRQLRDLNQHFLLDLGNQMPMNRIRTNETRLPVLPARQSGLMAGNGFVVCATCHYGQPKPMGGANVIADYPGLAGPDPGPSSPALAVSAPK